MEFPGARLTSATSFIASSDVPPRSKKSSRSSAALHRSVRHQSSSQHASKASLPCNRAAEPGTLEFFLAERYLLYSADKNGTLFEGRVHHAPYQLAPAQCEEWSTLPAAWDGLPPPVFPPPSALWVDHVDVSVYPLRRLTR